MKPSPILLSPSSPSPSSTENEFRNDDDEQLFQLEPNKVRTTFPAVLACLPTHRSAVEQAPELTSDDLLGAFMNGASRWGDVDDEVAVKLLQVVPCLPGLAPRCATRVALALQDHNHDVNKALAAYGRERVEVKIAESLYT
jgi:hypothetical protein